MVGEIYAGLSAAKTAFDIAKGLKDIDDAARRNAAIIELQERILATQQAQTTLIETIGRLEKKVASFEAWETKKERYELHAWPTGDFSYALKHDVQPREPPHHVCTACFEEKEKAYVLNRDDDFYHDRLKCPRCGHAVRIAPNNKAEEINEEARRRSASNNYF